MHKSAIEVLITSPGCSPQNNEASRLIWGRTIASIHKFFLKIDYYIASVHDTSGHNFSR